MSGVTPTSTTADLAKDVPLEQPAAGASSDVPGSFPETPAATEKSEFSVNPLPAFAGAVNPIKLAPGEAVPDPSTLTNNTVTSGVHDDPELVAADKKSEAEPTFSVAPLPEFPGAVNPIKLAPGEPVPDPSTLTNHTVTSGVHDDPELVAADKSAAEPTFSVAPLPGFPGAVNPITLAPGEKVPEVGSIISNTINSGVTLDKESYENSGALGNAPVLPPVVTPEHERNGNGVLDLPPISKNLIPESSLPIGAAGVGTFDASPMVQSSGPQSTTAELAASVPLEASKVPAMVKESQEEAGVAPEASAIQAEVEEKSAVEKELLKEIPVVPATSEGIADEESTTTENGVSVVEAVAVVGGAAAAVGGAALAYASGAASSVVSKLPTAVQDAIPSLNAESISKLTAKDTPEIVKESIAASGLSPEAAGNEEAVLEKMAVEKELLAEIKPETSTGEPAPKIAAVETPATLTTPLVEKPAESRDVSPGTVPGSHEETTGPTTPAKTSIPGPITPAKGTSSSSKVADSPAASSTADKKKKRISIFSKLKAKLSHKDS